MNKKQFAAIKRKERQATAGPWKWEYASNNAGMPTGFFYIPAHNGNAKVEMLADDARFCAEMRTDVKVLIKEIERLHKTLDKLVEDKIIKEWQACTGNQLLRKKKTK